MNREDIIRIAQEAGLHYSGRCTLTGMESHIERFAALVIANHPPQSYMTWQEGYEAGKQTERDACAKQLDALGCDHCAEAIRARGQA